MLGFFFSLALFLFLSFFSLFPLEINMHAVKKCVVGGKLIVKLINGKIPSDCPQPPPVLFVTFVPFHKIKFVNDGSIKEKKDEKNQKLK